jgi:hypothetical protein
VLWDTFCAGKIGSPHWSRKKKSLQCLATHLDEHVTLRLRFRAFGYCDHSNNMCRGNNRFNNRAAVIGVTQRAMK